MGAAVLLLILLVGPTAYAQPRRTAYRDAFYVPKSDAFYVPKSPRRPIIMVWPSVMNPSVAKKVEEKLWENREYLRIKCDYESHYVVEPFGTFEVFSSLDPFEEELRAPKFFDDVVFKLIQWLSAEVIQCGFNTIFPEKRQAIYRFINYNRSNWVKALQELTYILLQVIAVIHHKTNETLNWLKEWPESYEYWHTHAHMSNTTHTLDYLETFILGSFDIVTAWLFDYIAERTQWALIDDPKTTKPFWKFSNRDQWEFSDDPDIACALKSYDLYRASSWEYLTDTVVDKMKVMADLFITCNVTSRCEIYDSYDPIKPIRIYIGHKSSERVVKIPDPTLCEHTCTLLPNAPHRLKYYAYAHAHMTTEAGYDLHCRIDRTEIEHEIEHNIVRKQCRPQIVQKYLNDRTNMICCRHRSWGCCRSLRPRCEKLTLTLMNFTIESTRNIAKDMTTFEELRIDN